MCLLRLLLSGLGIVLYVDIRRVRGFWSAAMTWRPRQCFGVCSIIARHLKNALMLLTLGIRLSGLRVYDLGSRVQALWCSAKVHLSRNQEVS